MSTELPPIQLGTKVWRVDSRNRQGALRIGRTWIDQTRGQVYTLEYADTGLTRRGTMHGLTETEIRKLCVFQEPTPPRKYQTRATPASVEIDVEGIEAGLELVASQVERSRLDTQELTKAVLTLGESFTKSGNRIAHELEELRKIAKHAFEIFVSVARK